MRPTIKDLAREAGVSLATVDRVLNDRPNVSRRTLAKVQAAIERIDFVPNLAAANLARSRTYRFRFVLPEAGDEYLSEIIGEVCTIDAAMRTERVSVVAERVAIEDPHVVANHLSALDPATVDGVAIMAPESPQVRDAIARLVERGIRVVRLLSGRRPGGGVDFVGVDNQAAGATAARLLGRFLGPRKGGVMVLAETLRAHDSIERRLGFDAVLNASFPDLHALPSLETHADAQRTRQIVRTSLRHNEIVAVYLMSAEARVPLAALAEHIDLRDVVVIAHERTPFTVSGLQSGEIDAIIAQNPGHAVRSAVRLLRARTDNRAPVAGQEKLRIEILLKENL